MAFSDHAASRVAAGLAIRSILIGVLSLFALWLMLTQRLYATGVIVAGGAVLAAIDLARAVRAADRLFANFVEALAAGAADAPPRSAARFPALSSALLNAAQRLDRERLDRERRLQELEALADTVAAALIVVGDDGRAILANRAARDLCGSSGLRLADIAVLGGAATVLADLAPGARTIVRLADQRRMLASAAGFRSGGLRWRLISLQSVSAELSAVELRAWQDLVRVLAHEMMNSLTPIVSLAESISALDGPEADAAAASAMEVIARRSAGLMSFVERYRRVADVPAPALEDLEAARFVSGIDRLIRGQLGGKAIAYSSRITPPDARLHADPDLLEQALINLLKNAVEAVDGQADPRIELVCVAGEGETTLAVSDNGRGLPAVDPELVFTPFFTTKAGGSGIGLSLARQVALSHGGALVAAPNAPRGTVFSLRIPSGGNGRS
jgi:nitrogen fixation/metabolism regulation signal transduction histidine kinase